MTYVVRKMETGKWLSSWAVEVMEDDETWKVYIVLGKLENRVTRANEIDIVTKMENKWKDVDNTVRKEKEEIKLTEQSGYSFRKENQMLYRSQLETRPINVQINIKKHVFWILQ